MILMHLMLSKTCVIYSLIATNLKSRKGYCYAIVFLVILILMHFFAYLSTLIS